ALSAEERVFWGVLLSVALSSIIALGLAAAGVYRFNRLLWIEGAVSAMTVLVVGRRLRYEVPAAPFTWTALLPLGLLVTGFCLFSLAPPAEYVIGGKDPGVYMNEGIQIAQRGTLVIEDQLVRALPAPYQSLFFLTPDDPMYHITRFMGFFLLDPRAG